MYDVLKTEKVSRERIESVKQCYGDILTLSF